MAATNYTPIYLYNSGTTTNVPSSSNLGNGELAINYADGKLFYKNGSGVVTVLANASLGTLPVAIAYGGTNATATPTAGAVAYGTGTAYAFTSAGTSGYYLQSNGSSPPTWTAVSAGISTGKAIAMALIFGF
jgi:hypothetical protein